MARSGEFGCVGQPDPTFFRHMENRFFSFKTPEKIIAKTPLSGCA